VVLGLRVWELHLAGCRSLKEKRGVLLPLKERLRRGHNLSVAETAHQDSWQRAELGCAALGTDRAVVEECLRTADRIVEAADGVRILDTMTSYR
jgi:uncharacterized protein YlxP (DUF503 family)